MIDKRKNNIPFDLSVIKNNLDDVKKHINSGSTLFIKNDNSIVKICSNNQCHKLVCSKKCYKNNLYKSLKNFNRGIKTIYNLLFKLLLLNPIFRIQCKCCENNSYILYLQELEKSFNLNKKINCDFSFDFEPIKNLELNINFLINKFMGFLGILDCECKFNVKLLYLISSWIHLKSSIKDNSS